MVCSKHLKIKSISLLLLFAACGNDEVDNKPNPTLAAKQVVVEHFQLLNKHDLKGLVAQYENKARITTTDWNGVVFGPQAADQIFHQQFYVSPDARYLVDNMIITDSTVVVEYDVVGLKEKHNSPIRYDARNCSVFRINNHHISSEATYSNLKLYRNN